MKFKFLIFDFETVPTSIYKSTVSQVTLEEYNILFQKKLDQNQTDIFIPYPQYNQIIGFGAITAIFDTTNQKWSIENQTYEFDPVAEKDLLINFVKLLTPDIRIYGHFNGIQFDAPLVIWKSIKYGVYNKLPGAFTNLYKFQLKPHFDMYNFLSNYGVNPISFRVACTELGLEDPKATFSGSDIVNAYRFNNYDLIKKYIKLDTNTTYKLFQKLWELNPVN
jgi:predicted PolB exonuclease-like 3'-5' exonuclease